MAPHDAPTSAPSGADVADGGGGSKCASATAAPPEFVAAILAATAGARLFPLTSDADNAEDDDDGDDDGAGGASGDGTDGGDGGYAAEVRAPPKHLLPLAGTPLLGRLLRSVSDAGFESCAVSIAEGDDMTVPALEDMEGCERIKVGDAGSGPGGIAAVLRVGSMRVSVARVGADCGGSADALRALVEVGAVPRGSHAVVLPGDLLLGGGDALRVLADAHRRGCGFAPAGGGGARGRSSAAAPPAALTMLLADVGDEDEAGAPLKESAKAKKGGLARDEEDIEFIGLSPLPLPAPSHHPSCPWRVVLKQSRVAVEEDEDLTGSTPKLVLPKGRVRRCCLGGGGGGDGDGGMTVRTDLSDLHAYALSPWVLRLLEARPNLSSLQRELVPLLVGRQFRGAGAAFGSRALAEEAGAESLRRALAGPPFLASGGDGGGRGGGGDQGDQAEGAGLGGRAAAQAAARPFAISAHVLDRDASRPTLRACTVPAYLYGCREAVADAIPQGHGQAKGAGGGRPAAVGRPKPASAANEVPFLPEGTVAQPKFKSVLLPGASAGDKVKIQSTTVGRRSRVGNRCRLNNVVIMDDVAVGENCVLQNSVLGSGCAVGDNCNLNDCQVGPGARVPAGTKEKGETFMR